MKQIALVVIIILILGAVAIIPTKKVLGVVTQEAGPIRYVDYSEAIFKSESGKTRAICFLADWCDYCEKIDEEIKTTGRRIPKDTIIFKADFEDESELRREYSINIKHECLIFDKQGQVIKRTNPENIVSSLALQ